MTNMINFNNTPSSAHLDEGKHAFLRDVRPREKRRYLENYEALFQSLPKEDYKVALAHLHGEFSPEDLKLSIPKAMQFYKMANQPKEVKVEHGLWLFNESLVLDKDKHGLLDRILMESQHESAGLEIYQALLEQKEDWCLERRFLIKLIGMQVHPMDLPLWKATVQKVLDRIDMQQNRLLLLRDLSNFPLCEDLFRYAVDRGLDIMTDEKGQSPLLLTGRANEEALREIFREYVPENYIENPLHKAVAAGEVEVARALLNSGSCTLYHLNADGESALHLAVEKSDTQMVEMLLEYLDEGQLPTDFHHKTPLHWALERRQESIVELFLGISGLRWKSPVQLEQSHSWVALQTDQMQFLDRLALIEGVTKASQGPTMDLDYMQRISSRLEFCLKEKLYAPLKWLFENGHLRKPSEIHFTMLFEEGETGEALDLFRFLLERGDFQNCMRFMLKSALELKCYRATQMLVDNAFFEDSTYGNARVDFHWKIIVELLEASAPKEVQFYCFKKAPLTLFYHLFQNGNTFMTSGKDSLLEVMIQARTGMSEDESKDYLARVYDLLKDHDIVKPDFFSALFQSQADGDQAKKLLLLLEKLLHSRNITEADNERQNLLLSEFFYHIFTKFRPEFIRGEMSDLDHLLEVFENAHSDEEIALFFNTLQTQTSLEDIERAIRGSRFFTGLGEMASDEDLIDALYYIEVARYQKGKTFAHEIYTKRRDCPEMTRRALRALASLRVPFPEDFVLSLRERLENSETPDLERAEILRLIWSMDRNPMDLELKRSLLKIMEQEPEGVLLLACFELLESLEMHSVEIDQIWPQLEKISRCEDPAIRKRSAFALSRLNHEKALLRAAEIVQGRDWASYDSFHGHEKHLHAGHWLMFVRRPDFQDNRSSMIVRILDRLAHLKRGEIRASVREVWDPYMEKKNWEKAELYKEIHEPFLKMDLNTRYFGVPIYFPKGPLLRGLKARKGDALLYESIRDLIRHGAERADLSKFSSFEFATWCKIGHMFGTYEEKTANIYNGLTHSDEVGVTITFNRAYFNEELMKGFARLEHEKSINTVNYRGIPWCEIQSVVLPADFQVDFETLRGETPLEEVTWTTPTFRDLDPEELEDLRFYLRPVFEKFVFGSKPIENPIHLFGIKDKTVKRDIQREKVKALYPKETFAMPNEILENYTDEEYAKALPRMHEIFELETPYCTTPSTKGLSPRMSKIVRLAALFKGRDIQNLFAKKPLHGLNSYDLRIVCALIANSPYHDLTQLAGYPLLDKELYQQLILRINA